MSFRKKLLKSLFLAIIILSFTTFIFPQTEKETKKWNKCVEKAKKVKTSKEKIEIYKAFIQKNKDNFYIKEATRIVEEPGDFENAKTENTIESYKAYILKHPDGDEDHAWEVKNKIKDLFFKDITIVDLIKDFASYGITGTYTSDPSAAPNVEKGILRGKNFKIIITRYDREGVLNIPSIHRSVLRDIHFRVRENIKFNTTMVFRGRNLKTKFGANMELEDITNHGALNTVFENKSAREYVELCYFRDDPIFICALSKDDSVFKKLVKFYDSIIK